MNSNLWNDLAAREEVSAVWGQGHDVAQVLLLLLPLFLGLIFLAGLVRAKLLCKA